MVQPAARRIRRLYDVVAAPGCRAWIGVREGPARFEQKVLVKTAARADRDAAATIAREARTCGRLDHPAIPQVLDVFEERGELKLVLQWSEGVGLGALLEESRKRNVRLPLPAIAHIGVQLFSALDAAHNARDPKTREFAPVVHQAVSPATIRVGVDGRIRLGDFGGSRTLAAFELTPAGLLDAHEGYLAPEQVLGHRPSVRTDVYSACLVLREMLVGVEAFPRVDCDYLEWLERIAHPALLDITAFRDDLDPSIAWLMHVGLRPERDARSVTAAIAAEVLAPFALDGPQALAELVRGLYSEEIIASETRMIAEPAVAEPPDDDRPTVNERRVKRPALDPVVTPPPVLHAISGNPTLPSIRRRRRTPWIAASIALPLLAGAAFLLARKKPVESTPNDASAGSVSTAEASSPPRPASPPPKPPPRATIDTSSIAHPEELARVLDDVGAQGRFERCFTVSEKGGDKPRNGQTLRLRCKGGPTLTLLSVTGLDKRPHRVAAYTEATLEPWTGWRADPKATLVAFDPYTTHRAKNPKLAVDNRDGSFGPSFGAGHDLHVGVGLETGLSFPKSYLDRDDKTFVGGIGPFRIDRLEVFLRR